MQCSSLEKITLPDVLTTLGDNAFRESGLTSIRLPAKVASLEAEVFYACYNLTKIEVDADNPSYSSLDGVLFNKEKTTLVLYPAGISGAYQIPDGVTLIQESFFWGCTNLVGVIIPNSVTEIGDKAFYGCSYLESVTVGNSVYRIGTFTFAQCTRLVTIDLPSSLTSFGSWSFATCPNLRSVYFYGNAPSDGRDVFSESAPILYYIEGIQGWTNPWMNCETAISTGPLEDGVRIVTQPQDYCLLLEGSKLVLQVKAVSNTPISYQWYKDDDLIEGATEQILKINAVTLASAGAYNVIATTTDGYSDTSDIATVEILAKGEENPSTDFKYTIAEETVTITGYIGNATFVIIPEKIEGLPVVAIGDSAFENNELVETVVIPEGITSIGALAFSTCSVLKYVMIPDTVTTIGRGCFFQCYALQSLMIPASVTWMGDSMFHRCYMLKKLYFFGTIPSGCEWMFDGTNMPIIYYPINTIGWGDTWNGCVTATWSPYVEEESESPVAQISAPAYTEEGKLVFTVSFSTGTTLQRSTDMVTWEDVPDAADGSYSVEVGVDAPQRYFFRCVAP